MEAHQSSFLRRDDHQLQISSTSDGVDADNEDGVLGNQLSFLFTADHQLRMLSTMIWGTSHRFYSYSYPYSKMQLTKGGEGGSSFMTPFDTRISILILIML